jgi:hypothetical protein
MLKHLNKGTGYCDSFANLKKNLHLANKQFKTMIQTAEKQNILKRFFKPVECKIKKHKNSDKVQTKKRQIRMVKLTDAYYKMMLSHKQMGENEGGDDLSDTAELGELNEAGPSELTVSLRDSIGSEQAYIYPLYTQIFSKIEEYDKEGISLKQLGTLFGLDFYKSRRMGANLQTHPEIVTIIKETDRGKAKYQTIVFRKFLSQAKPVASASDSQMSISETNQSSNEPGELSESAAASTEADLLVIKRSSSKNK